MQFKITNGDYTLNARGRVELAASNPDSIMQRVRNRLTIRRGSFVYDPELGSELHLIARTKPSDREALAWSYCYDALQPEMRAGYVQRINSVEISYPDPKTLLVAVSLTLTNGDTAETEVQTTA